MTRLELVAQMFDASGVAIQRQIGMQPRRHHPHARVGFQQQFDLAAGHGATADHQGELIAQVEEHRQVIHGRTLADRAALDAAGRAATGPRA